MPLELLEFQGHLLVVGGGGVGVGLFVLFAFLIEQFLYLILVVAKSGH